MKYQKYRAYATELMFLADLEEDYDTLLRNAFIAGRRGEDTKVYTNKLPMLRAQIESVRAAARKAKVNP